MDELAQQSVVANDGRVGADVRRTWGIARQAGEIGETADVVDDALVAEDLRHGHRVAGAVRLDELGDRCKDQLVITAIEVFALDEVGNPIPGAGIEHQAAKDGLLGLH